MLETDIEAIVIATSMQLHVQQALVALEAGKHVLSYELIANYKGLIILHITSCGELKVIMRLPGDSAISVQDLAKRNG